MPQGGLSIGINNGTVIGPKAQFLGWSSTIGTPIMLGSPSKMQQDIGTAVNARCSILVGNNLIEHISAANLGGNILITGGTETFNNCLDCIVIDTDSDTGYAQKTITGLQHEIIIGNSSHTKITIGGVDFSAVGGATVKVNNANVVLTSIQTIVMYTAIAAAKTVTLPAASAVPAGVIVRVGDYSGSPTALITITINPAGADTILPVAGFSNVINSAYGSKSFMSDGVSKWLPRSSW